MPYTIAAFYRFTPIGDAEALRLELKQKLTLLDLCGTLLVAPEGINGTLAGTEGAIEAMLEMLKQRPKDLDAFANISGVGANKLARYGKAFLAVLAAHW